MLRTRETGPERRALHIWPCAWAASMVSGSHWAVKVAPSKRKFTDSVEAVKRLTTAVDARVVVGGAWPWEVMEVTTDTEGS